MAKKRFLGFITIVLIILLLLPNFTVSILGAEKYRIMVISSYDPSFPTSLDFIDGVNEIFYGETYELDFEFMDTKEVYSHENLEAFKTYITKKISMKTSYDLILTFDDNALNFVYENKDGLFKGIPVVFAGMNDFKQAEIIAESDQFTGVIESISVEETFDLMSSLQNQLS